MTAKWKKHKVQTRICANRVKALAEQGFHINSLTQGVARASSVKRSKGYFVSVREAGKFFPTGGYGPFKRYEDIVKFVVEYKMGNEELIKSKKLW